MSLAERFILLETWTTVEHLVLIGVRVILARALFHEPAPWAACPDFASHHDAVILHPPRHRKVRHRPRTVISQPLVAPRDAPKDNVANGVHRPRDAKDNTRRQVAAFRAFPRQHFKSTGGFSRISKRVAVFEASFCRK